MQFGKLYSDVTKLPREESFVNPPDSVAESNEDAARVQAQHSWKQSTITQELVKELQSDINTLLTDTVALAVSYPTHSNHNKIIQNLIRVDTLSKLLDTHIYGNH